MSQPTTYNRQTSFSNYQAQNPTSPLSGSVLDAELNAVKVTLDEILENLELIQRDDGYLANESVGLDQLSPEIEVGWQAPEVWVTATDYVVGNTVFHGSGFYRVLEDHTAGTFATDLAADKLELIVDLAALTLAAASSIAVTPTGGIAATTVQAALAELDSEKAAASHTHPASAISDSTAAGRTLLTSNLAGQQSALGLGALAYLNSITVTDINANIGLSGIIAPSALGASVNDWTPTGVATASTIRLSASTTGVNITGLAAAAADGDIKILENIGSSYAVTLMPQNTSSAAANRLAIPKPLIIGPNASAALKYHLADARWRLLDRSAHLPRGFIDGLIFTNGSDATNDFDISAGECRGTRGILDLVLTSSLTKRLDEDWAAGTNAGCRYSGAAITNTTYHYFLIGKADGTTDIFAYAGGTDPTAVLPSGYIDYRLIGSFVRAGATLPGIVQDGDQIQLKAPVRDQSATTVTSTASNLTLASIPTGVRVLAEMNLTMSNGGTGYIYLSDPSVNDAAPTLGGAAPGATIGWAGSGVASGLFDALKTAIRVNTSAQVRARSDSSRAVDIYTLGYWHPRGKNL